MREIQFKAAALSFVAATLSGCSKADFKYTGLPGVAAQVPLGDRMTESFYQNKAQGQVDILVVDDNSASMAREQTKLGQRFSQFTQALDKIDFQIGVVTTDIESANSISKGSLVQLPGEQTRILKANHPNAQQAFSNLVEIGTGGSGTEQPLGASLMAFDKRNAEDAGFFRDGTDLAILVMSDEDEMSDGSQGTTASQVIDHFKNIWGDSKRLIAFGIVIKPGDTACLAQQAAESASANNAFYGSHVADLAARTGGETFSICDSDYSSSLIAIGQKVRNLVFSIELSTSPVVGTVQVEISTGEQIPFRVEGKRIIFDRAPQQGAKVVVSYNRPKAV